MLCVGWEAAGSAGRGVGTARGVRAATDLRSSSSREKKEATTRTEEPEVVSVVEAEVAEEGSVATEKVVERGEEASVVEALEVVVVGSGIGSLLGTGEREEEVVLGVVMEEDEMMTTVQLRQFDRGVEQVMMVLRKAGGDQVLDLQRPLTWEILMLETPA